jgi:hypothetical protein
VDLMMGLTCAIFSINCDWAYSEFYAGIGLCSSFLFLQLSVSSNWLIVICFSGKNKIIVEQGGHIMHF